MAKIRTREIGASVAITFGVEGALILCIGSLAHIHAAQTCKRGVVACHSRGEHTVENINPAHYRFNNIIRRSNSHKVARSVLGQDRVDDLEHLFHLSLRLANRQAANGVAGQIQAGDKFG